MLLKYNFYETHIEMHNPIFKHCMRFMIGSSTLDT
jgi:hypothetical protein